MGLRLQATADTTTVTHWPGGHLALGLAFVVGGLFTVAATLGLAHNAAQQSVPMRAVAVFIGGMGVVVGVHFLKSAPASVVAFDRVRAEVRVRHRGVGGAQTETFPLAEVVAVEVVTSKDSDGDPMFKVAVRRANGVLVLLSPVAEHHGPPEVARALAAELGLPLPA